MSKYSAESALLKENNYSLFAVDSGKCAVRILLKVTAAFDTTKILLSI